MASYQTQRETVRQIRHAGPEGSSRVPAPHGSSGYHLSLSAPHRTHGQVNVDHRPQNWQPDENANDSLWKQFTQHHSLIRQRIAMYDPGSGHSAAGEVSMLLPEDVAILLIADSVWSQLATGVERNTLEHYTWRTTVTPSAYHRHTLGVPSAHPRRTTVCTIGVPLE